LGWAGVWWKEGRGTWEEKKKKKKKKKNAAGFIWQRSRRHASELGGTGNTPCGGGSVLASPSLA